MHGSPPRFELDSLEYQYDIMARKIQSRTKPAKTAAPDPREPDAVAPGFETSEEAVFHQLYDPGCTPLTPAEADSCWRSTNASWASAGRPTM